MHIRDVHFYADSDRLGGLTVLTNTPQTNCEWLAQHLAKSGVVVRLEPSPILPQLPSDANLSTVVLLGTEMPVLCGSETARGVWQAIELLEGRCSHLVVCLTLSEALTNPCFSTGAELQRLAVMLLHSAELILQLQPLSTGRARDITGRLVVAPGPSSSRTVLERELFYFVQKSVELRECS